MLKKLILPLFFCFTSIAQPTHFFLNLDTYLEEIAAEVDVDYQNPGDSKNQITSPGLPRYLLPSSKTHVRLVIEQQRLLPFGSYLNLSLPPHISSIHMATGAKEMFPTSPLQALVQSLFPGDPRLFIPNRLTYDPLSSLSPSQLGALVALTHELERGLEGATHIYAWASRASEEILKVLGVKGTPKILETIEPEEFIRLELLSASIKFCLNLREETFKEFSEFLTVCEEMVKLGLSPEAAPSSTEMQDAAKKRAATILRSWIADESEDDLPLPEEQLSNAQETPSAPELPRTPTEDSVPSAQLDELATKLAELAEGASQEQLFIFLLFLENENVFDALRTALGSTGFTSIFNLLKEGEYEALSQMSFPEFVSRKAGLTSTRKTAHSNNLRLLRKRGFSDLLAMALSDQYFTGKGVQNAQLVQKALVAFFWARYKTLDDIKAFYEGYFGKNLRGVPIDSSTPDQMLEVLHAFRNSPPSFYSFLPHEREFLIWQDEVSTNFKPYAPMRAHFFGATYSNCVEITALNFILRIALTASPGDLPFYDPAALPEGPARSFLEEHLQGMSLAENSIKEAWSHVVSGHSEETEIIYYKETEHGGCEIISGAVNFLNLMRVILPLQTPALIMGEVGEEMLQENFQEIARVMSRDDRPIELSVSEIVRQLTFPDYSAVVGLKIKGQKLAVLDLGPGHAVFKVRYSQDSSSFSQLFTQELSEREVLELAPIIRNPDDFRAAYSVVSPEMIFSFLSSVNSRSQEMKFAVLETALEEVDRAPHLYPLIKNIPSAITLDFEESIIKKLERLLMPYITGDKEGLTRNQRKNLLTATPLLVYEDTFIWVSRHLPEVFEELEEQFSFSRPLFLTEKIDGLDLEAVVEHMKKLGCIKKLTISGPYLEQLFPFWPTFKEHLDYQDSLHFHFELPSRAGLGWISESFPCNTHVIDISVSEQEYFLGDPEGKSFLGRLAEAISWGNEGPSGGMTIHGLNFGNIADRAREFQEFLTETQATYPDVPVVKIRTDLELPSDFYDTFIT